MASEGQEQNSKTMTSTKAFPRKGQYPQGFQQMKTSTMPKPERAVFAGGRMTGIVPRGTKEGPWA